MKVSILVAVYNAERYLAQCLDSLTNQTHRDIEIICIDDASTDHSWQMLCDYARRDNRIILLQQTENQGQAVARNRGLEVATGDYVTMLDSDDWLSPDALEQACSVAEKSPENDCILLDVVIYDENTGCEEAYCYRTKEHEYTGDEAFRLSLDWSIHGLYMVRRHIHTAYPYETTCRLYSDDNTTRLHYLHSRRVCRSKGIYYYRRHNQSMTQKVSIMRFEYLRANFSMKQTMVAEQVATPLLDLYEAHRWLNLVGMYVFYWNHRKEFTPEERKHIRKELRHYYDTIETHRLPSRLKCKFGYIPFRFCPLLFEVQACGYAHLRKWYHRGKVE